METTHTRIRSRKGNSLMRAGLLFILMTTAASICTFSTRHSTIAIQAEFRNPPSSSDTQLSTSEKVFSSQHTRWLIQALPNTMKPEPWTTRVYMGASESGPDVELRFVDEANGGVSVRWLNEKLIFGEVWWGRIYATDFIFDVEQRKFIYREMAHFGELMEPCR